MTPPTYIKSHKVVKIGKSYADYCREAGIKEVRLTDRDVKKILKYKGGKEVAGDLRKKLY